MEQHQQQIWDKSCKRRLSQLLQLKPSSLLILINKLSQKSVIDDHKSAFAQLSEGYKYWKKDGDGNFRKGPLFVDVFRLHFNLLLRVAVGHTIESTLRVEAIEELEWIYGFIDDQNVSMEKSVLLDTSSSLHLNADAASTSTNNQQQLNHAPQLQVTSRSNKSETSSNNTPQIFVALPQCEHHNGKNNCCSGSESRDNNTHMKVHGKNDNDSTTPGALPLNNTSNDSASLLNKNLGKTHSDNTNTQQRWKMPKNNVIKQHFRTAESGHVGLHRRVECHIKYLQNSSILARGEKTKVNARLQIWEPFWECLVDLTPGYCDKKRELTPSCLASVQKVSPHSNSGREWHEKLDGTKPQTAVSFRFQLPNNEKLRKVLYTKIPFGQTPMDKYDYEKNPVTLLLRMIPLTPTKRKADCHLWPKGTFVQINGNSVDKHLMTQRRQQSHDDTLWKGMSHALDLSPFITRDKLDRLHQVDICSYDKEKYAFQVALVKWRSPVTLYEALVQDRPSDDKHHSSDLRLAKSSVEESMSFCKRIFENNETVVLDSDDGVGADNTTSNTPQSITLNLISNISGVRIKRPVRGKNCQHQQCIDLEYYLWTNSIPCGSRWRCPVCDKFVPVRDLVYCEFFMDMLNKGAATGHKEVKLNDDGTYRLFTTKIKPNKRRSSTSLNQLAKRVKTQK